MSCSRKILFYFLGVFLFLIVCAIALAPTILSTEWGKELALGLVNETRKEKFDIKRVSLSWFSTQEIEQLSIKDSDKNTILYAETIVVDSPLWKLLLKPASIRSITVKMLHANPMPNVAIKDVNVHITPSSISVSGLTKQNALEGNFIIDALLKNITTENLIRMESKWENLLKDSSDAELKVNIDIAHFPVAIFDQVLSLKHPALSGLLLQLLGDQLNVNAKPTVTPEGIIITVDASSPKLNTQLTFKIDESIKLEKTSTLSLVLSPSDVKQFNPAVIVQNPVKATFTLNRFSLPLSTLHNGFSISSEVWEKLDSDINLTLSPINIKEMATVKNIDLSNFSMDLQASPRKMPTASIKAILALAPAPDMLKSINIHSETVFAINKDAMPTVDHIDLSLINNLINIDVKAKVQDLDTLKASGTIKSKKIDLSSLNQFKDFHAQNSSQTADIVLDDFVADWTINETTNLVTVDYHAIASLLKRASSEITGSLYIKDWVKNESADDFDKTSVQFYLRAPKIPVELIGELINQQDLPLILGDAINLAIESNFRLLDTPEGYVEIGILSPYLKGNLSLGIDKTIHLYENGQPAELYFTLTPSSYSFLRYLNDKTHANDFTLAENANILLRLQKLNISPHSQWESEVKVDFSIDHLAVMDNKNKQIISLNDVKGGLLSKNLSKKIAFEMSAYGQATQDGASSWDLSGTLENGFNHNGELNLTSLSLSLDASVSKLPIAMLCHVICNPTLGKQVNAIIGPTLNGKIQTKLQDMNGPIFIDIQGKNGHIQVDALIAEGILKLNKNIEAEILLSEDLSNHVLQTFIPIAANIIASDQPLKLKIDREGFLLPIYDVNIITASVGKAMLEIGKVRFSHQSQIAQVFNLLKPGSKEELSVQFTPAYCSISNGVVKLERLDLLINNDYPIATWGTIDIGKDRVNMIIGIFGSAIDKAFGLSNVSKSYVLQLPLRGALNSPSIDKAKAATRISSLIAQTQGGAQGVILGTVLDLAMGSESTPPPTTSPLPWQNLMENKSGETKKHTPVEHDTIEEAGKAAGSIIKKLLKK